MSEVRAKNVLRVIKYKMTTIICNISKQDLDQILAGRRVKFLQQKKGDKIVFVCEETNTVNTYDITSTQFLNDKQSNDVRNAHKDLFDENRIIAINLGKKQNTDTDFRLPVQWKKLELIAEHYQFPVAAFLLTNFPAGKEDQTRLKKLSKDSKKLEAIKEAIDDILNE